MCVRMRCRFEKSYRHGKERYEPPANYKSFVLIEFCSSKETDAAAQAHTQGTVKVEKVAVTQPDTHGTVAVVAVEDQVKPDDDAAQADTEVKDKVDDATEVKADTDVKDKVDDAIEVKADTDVKDKVDDATEVGSKVDDAAQADTEVKVKQDEAVEADAVNKVKVDETAQAEAKDKVGSDAGADAAAAGSDTTVEVTFKVMKLHDYEGQYKQEFGECLRKRQLCYSMTSYAVSLVH